MSDPEDLDEIDEILDELDELLDRLPTEYRMDWIIEKADDLGMPTDYIQDWIIEKDK